jgi:pyruvate/2-oxoglutarate dehydrogenase complex dihydrolipoamide dehydrogenase (E3) component
MLLTKTIKLQNADHIIIATGARSVNYLTYHKMVKSNCYRSDDLPSTKIMIIVGSGAIGVEFAHFITKHL